MVVVCLAQPTVDNKPGPFANQVFEAVAQLLREALAAAPAAALAAAPLCTSSDCRAAPAAAAAPAPPPRRAAPELLHLVPAPGWDPLMSPYALEVGGRMGRFHG
jgi:hypothetical protein